jgi:hypothetical protein
MRRTRNPVQGSPLTRVRIPPFPPGYSRTEGKVERPYRYIQAAFFLARCFANLEDLNRQLRQWLDAVANVRLHGTTGRVVAEHFAAERASLQPFEEHGMTYLADADADNPLASLQAASCTYRIAFGPRAGHKVLSLQTVARREG